MFSLLSTPQHFRHQGHRFPSGLVNLKHVGTPRIIVWDGVEQKVAEADDDRDVILQTMNDVVRHIYPLARVSAAVSDASSKRITSLISSGLVR